ncbi:MAG: hypothetical protein IT423_14120 [Pirellulaceae bacterium]|nr:hypothetical protein [Pirellulaceae bacterium]
MTKVNITKILFVLIALASISGCNSGRYPVLGTAKYADGTPVEGGTVIAEGEVDGKLVSLQANIEADGTFKLGGADPGDGALPGSYRAIIMPVALGDAELAAGKKPSVAGKFTKFETSGIEFTVLEGKTDLNIVVSK